MDREPTTLPTLPLPAAAPRVGWLRRLLALARGRCPRCLESRIFGGVVAMNEYCPTCGLRFGREAGYFLGAMYFSYGISVVGIGAFLLLGSWLFPDWSWTAIVTVATAAYVPFVPAAFRASRVIWLYFDHYWDPA